MNQNVAYMRPRAVALDAILGTALPVLDHGSISVVDYMGNDHSIANSARLSYAGGTRTVNDDRGLIRYLMRHWHTSPFESCEIQFLVRCPIFVARQWLRHRTPNVNEMSGRYSIMDMKFYMPDPERLGRQSKANKQGTDATGYDLDTAADILDVFAGHRYGVREDYEWLTAKDVDLARELARIDLPLSTYTEFSWKVDLHNLFHFLRLRTDSHAQYEIRVYAEVIERICETWVPIATQAWRDYRKDAVTFSRMEMEVLRDMLGGLTFENIQSMQDSLAFYGDISDRELREFSAKIDGAGQ